MENTCPKGSFVCLNFTSQCVEQQKICDGIENCADGSDEIQCGMRFLVTYRLFRLTFKYSILYHLQGTRLRIK